MLIKQIKSLENKRTRRIKTSEEKYDEKSKAE